MRDAICGIRALEKWANMEDEQCGRTGADGLLTPLIVCVWAVGSCEQFPSGRLAFTMAVVECPALPSVSELLFGP